MDLISDGLGVVFGVGVYFSSGMFNVRTYLHLSMLRLPTSREFRTLLNLRSLRVCVIYKFLILSVD